MRVVFMGTPDFAVPSLRMLAGAGYEIVGVYTQPDRPAGRGKELHPSPIKQLALTLGLPVFQPPRLRGVATMEQLQALNPDVIVVAAFGQILRREVLELPALGCVNVHASLLPRHRGAAPISAAILAGDETAGVTIMLMDEGIDTGPMLAQADLRVEPGDTTGSLTAKLSELGGELLLKTLPRWAAGELKPQPQGEQMGPYAKLLNKEEGEVAWHEEADLISRRVRAFQPWPGAFTFWQGKLIKLIEASPLEGDLAGAPPGTVGVLELQTASQRRAKSLVIQTGKGLLAVSKLQLEGKKVTTSEEFMAGHRSALGARLGRSQSI